MNFRKTSERGGGVTSDPKNFVVLFSLKEKGGLLHPEKFRCKKHNIVFPKIGWGGGGGSEAVWKFSENSSNLLDQVIPKQGLRVRTLDIPRVTKNKSTCNNSAGIYSLKTNQWSLTIGQ